MLLNPLSLMGSSYADNSLTWSAQRTLNWLPETAEVDGTRTPVKFAQPPGLRVLVDLGTGSPIRGLHNVEGKLFAVSGTDLFEISTAYAATDRGNIPGVARVSMAHNKQGGAAAANELVIANGLSGYVYNTASATLAQITDDAFQGANTVDYVDGFITFTDPQGRFWGHSALNQATSFSSIDRYDAESAPDPIISHIVSHREVMVFGTRTTEFFRNTGAATGTFQRVDGTELEVGICAPLARARIDNSVCWVADSLEVFRLEGHAPQRISTRPIEQMLHTVNPANIFAFAWEDRGHKVFYITAPEAFTLGFDFASGMWHERQTIDIPRWRVNDAVAWNGLWVVGDYSNGLLYELDWDTYHENGLELIRERASGYTHGGQNKVLAPYVELLFDVGPDNALPVIVGDVPNGFIGTDVSGAYVVSGGIAPYSAITVLSGTFPAGLTLNPDGTYIGEYTTEAVYSWTVGGVDAFGTPFSIADSATVSSAAITNWVKRPHPMAQTALDVHVADGIIAIVGNNNTGIYSTDLGVSWTSLSLPSMGPSNPVYCITKFDGRWFALGVNEGMTAVGDTFAFTALANAPNVAQRGNTVHDGQLYVSSQSNAGSGLTTKLQKLVTLGAAWTVIDTGIVNGGNVIDMATGGGVTILVTDQGNILRTTDMVSFTDEGYIDSPAPIQPGTGVAYLGGRFIVSANNGVWRYSDDGGQNWTLGTTVANRFIIATSQIFAGGDDTTIHTSGDGDAWIDRLSTAGPITLNGGASADQTLAAVTDISLAVRVGTT